VATRDSDSPPGRSPPPGRCHAAQLPDHAPTEAYGRSRPWNRPRRGATRSPPCRPRSSRADPAGLGRGSSGPRHASLLTDHSPSDAYGRSRPRIQVRRGAPPGIHARRRLSYGRASPKSGASWTIGLSARAICQGREGGQPARARDVLAARLIPIEAEVSCRRSRGRTEPPPRHCAHARAAGRRVR
jgi:hypothetical protein